MASKQAILHREDMAIERALYISFELGDKAWKLTWSDDRRHPAQSTIAAGDRAALLDCIARAKARCGLPAHAPVHSCYEAGRDGWWLHRWLCSQGIDNIVVDSSSIEVNRRARRAKSDRLDGEKLLAMLLRHRRGERVWSVLHVPSAEAEDERRVSREWQRLTHEATAHSNRIGALLVLHNLRFRQTIGAKAWATWWTTQREPLPPRLRAEIERECERLALVRQQMRALEAQRRHERQQHPLVQQLERLRALGERSSWLLVTELFGWRRFDNRRQLAAIPTGATLKPIA